MDEPLLFSVVIPTYNRAQLVSRAIKSVLSQTYPHFEVIVIDDGSTDNTEQVVSSLKDSRISYVKKENGERGAARNYGVARSMGDYVTFLDSDDMMYRECLTTASITVSDYGRPSIFHLAYEIRSEGDKAERKVLLPALVNEELLKGNPLSCIGVFLRRDIALEHPFPEARELAGSEDWVLWLKLAARYPIVHIPRVSACLIQHERRSVLKIEKNMFLRRIEGAYQEILKDQAVKGKFSERIRMVRANLYIYASLHLVLGGFRKEAIKLFLKSVFAYWPALLSKRGAVLVSKLALHVSR